tara:strand:- start:2658 stop:3224 length:567 start_codon:yes stop_codon:yes gene_type:complete
MIQGHVFLVLLLMLIGATVLWIFISSSTTKWYLKATLTTLVLFSILSAWIGLKTMYGYPYHDWPNNEKYIMIGSFVEEPEIKEPGSGAIYLWLIDNNKDVKGKSWVDIVAYTINGRQPRVYVIQYNREMHEQVAKMEEMRKGQPMPINLIKEDQGKEQMEVHQGNDREDRQEYVPYIMPDAIIIDKIQ